MRIVIVPDLDAVNAVKRQRKKVNLTDLVFKQNQNQKIDEHPFFFRDNNLQGHVPVIPDNPFYGTMPYISGPLPGSFYIQSGSARPESVNQHDTIQIRIQNQILDPDLVCML